MIGGAIVFLLLALGPASAHALEEQRYGDVAYLTGGVGAGESSELRRRAQHYKLQITAAQRGSGNYLSDVRVLVRQGAQTILEATMDGPVLYAKLPPGRYAVRCEFQGKAIERSIAISPRQPATLYLYWD
jgi:hypothetical protein